MSGRSPIAVRAGRLVPAILASLALARGLAAQDTIVVRADNTPVWGDSPTLVEELRIGALEGDEDLTFGRITGLLVDRQGVIWVADAQAATVRRFRPDGTHLDNIGTKGGGPGEFDGGYGISLARLPNETVLVFDPLRFRSALSVFSESGDHLRGMPADLGGITGAPFAVRVDTAGVLRIRSVKVLDFGIPASLGTTRPMRTQGIWLTPDSAGGVADTLFMPLSDPTSEGGAGYLFGTMQPYTPRTMSALSPFGYIVSGRSDRYAIHRPTRDGRVVRIERSWEPIAAKEGEREQYRRQLAVSIQTWGRNERNTVEIPATKPPFWELDVDDDGRIWVARHQEGVFEPETPEAKAYREGLPVVTPPLEWREPLVTDVIEPSGRFLGTIRWPNNQAMLALTRGDTVWAIERGAFDEEYVVRYRIEHR